MVIQDKDKGIFFTALSNYAAALEKDLKVLENSNLQDLYNFQKETLKRTNELLEEL